MKVLFDISRGQITIEGEGADLIAVLQHAREIAPKLGEIRLITAPPKANDSSVPPLRQDGAVTGNDEGDGPTRQGVPTLREFVKMASPTTAAERIITIGVYQARYHAQDSFSPKAMADWFEHSGLQKPTQMPVAMFATKKRFGFLENLSHGRWRVTTAGQNAVTRMIEEKGGIS